MDIRSGCGYPAASLSNFTPHPFELDGVKISSMEGFLQSTKFSNPAMQEHVCTLVGLAAKYKGKPKEWWRDGKLFWRGKELDRFGQEYQDLLDRAYNAMAAQNEGFRKALLATGDAVLQHSIGKRDEKRTILTVSEFCGRLHRIRRELQAAPCR